MRQDPSRYWSLDNPINAPVLSIVLKHCLELHHRLSKSLGVWHESVLQSLYEFDLNDHGMVADTNASSLFLGIRKQISLQDWSHPLEYRSLQDLDDLKTRYRRLF